ncbi:MAG: bifunctional adenosylcobinamide kinase/adenosylcobinamide-phosphate guanylyltransferase [Bacteroidales bacterium]|nr:bifunctional adenosylcobinamide kinase/adenosylcobinamide-phosphate guanylyltransferase [Bacteroidales bacterium]
MKKIILITGGARSGKSSYAENLACEIAQNLGKGPIYIATAHIWDSEFAHRVELHKQRRGAQWKNIEEEIYLSKIDIEGSVALIDCVTLWCTNFYYQMQQEIGEERNAVKRAEALQGVLEKIKSEFNSFTTQDGVFIFVTNEIGCGGVSTNTAQREFTDLQGWVNQYIAAKADEVIMMVSGISVKIKGNDK